MPRITLDLNKIAKAQPGVLEITTEMDFLRHADDDAPLLIRGGLCPWAELYYSGRKIPFEYAASRAEGIVKVCPSLTETQAEEIVQKFGAQISTLPPQSLPELLQQIYPSAVWDESSSIEHLAEYLLWLWKNDVDASLQPLIRYQAEQWERRYYGPAPLPYHRAFDRASALAVLDEWLGINHDNAWTVIGKFPKAVPGELQNRAIDTWKKEIITSQGQLFYELREKNLPYSLIREASRETARYFISHKNLNEEWFILLKDYLAADPELLAEMRKAVPPELPQDLPGDVFKIVDWFKQQYLPYREWQLAGQDSDAGDTVSGLARQFEEWCLRTYPEMLLGHPLQSELCYQKMSRLAAEHRSVVTFVVLLDGLNLTDSRQLVAKIQEQIPKLQIKSDASAYSVLPTITSFCKEALVRGVPPKYTEETERVGKLIPAGKTPVALLRTAQKGEVYIWSIIEPDETYHKLADKPVLVRSVEAQLDGIVKKLRDVVEELPGDLPLEIIVTSDHGRLLTTSQRRIPIPEGMESHGRAAYGRSSIEFPSSGYLIENDVVYLHASRFGLPVDAVMPMDESTFLTSDHKSGVEYYSHGGLYPEEVIVPWVEFVRDVVKPKLEIHITGSGVAEMEGTLSLNILNLSDDEVEVQSLEMFLASGRKQLVKCGWNMPARDQQTKEVPVSSWPTRKEAASISGILHVTDEKGFHFTYPCAVTLEVEELYSTDTPDIFGDLL